jgi:hypothetical protein
LEARTDVPRIAGHVNDGLGQIVDVVAGLPAEQRAPIEAALAARLELGPVDPLDAASGRRACQRAASDP